MSELPVTKVIKSLDELNSADLELVILSAVKRLRIRSAQEIVEHLQNKDKNSGKMDA